MAATKRAQPSTHPTVYVGLALATIGLLLAVYAYTGTRIYDVRFALVALGGALLAVAGIFVAAWGRAILASRAQRARRGLDRAGPDEPSSTDLPTVAAPAEKKRFDFAASARKLVQRKEKPAEPEETPARGAFAFKRRAAPPPPPAPPEEPPTEARASPSASEASAAAAVVVQEAPPSAEPAAPALERVTLKCPRCTTEFTAEGIRPFPIQCPSCGLAGTL